MDYLVQYHDVVPDVLPLTWEKVKAPLPKRAALKNLTDDMFNSTNIIYAYVAIDSSENLYPNGRPIAVHCYHIKIDKEGR